MSTFFIIDYYSIYNIKALKEGVENSRNMLKSKYNVEGIQHSHEEKRNF